MRHTVSSQQQIIRQQKDLLRRGNNYCPLDPNLAVAAAVGVNVPVLNLRDVDIKSRLWRLLATRFPDGVLFNESSSFQNMFCGSSLRLLLPSRQTLDRATLMDPPRPVASLTHLRIPDFRTY